MMTEADSSAVDIARDDADVIALSVTRPQLFGLIYERHVDDIHRYLSRRVGPALADDLAADTF